MLTVRAASSGGTYVVQLILSDGTVNSHPDTVTVLMEDSRPVGDAGPDQTGHVGDIAVLDGSQSSDVDGDPLTCRWSLTSKPHESEAALDDPGASRPSFVIDSPGTYVAQLIVNDGTVDGAPDTVTIVTQNSRPVADAGADQTAFVENVVTLDGSKSSDVDGDLLTYHWSFSIRPEGSGAVLSDATAVRPTFEIDLPGTYVVQLVVNDGKLESLPDMVTIVTENSRPVADAGADRTLLVTDRAILDGSASRDADGDPLTYHWSLTSAPSGSAAVLSDPASARPSFLLDMPGTYVAQLIVNDGTLSSDPDTMVVSTENSRPVAKAGPDQAVHAGETVSLNGSASSDVDADPLTYQWSITSRPEGSMAVLSDATAVSPTFVADAAGTFVAQLIARDGNLASLPDTVVVVVGNRKPTAGAGPDQAVTEGDTVRLNGGASTDLDGDTLSFAWTITSRPSGSAAVLSGETTATPTFVADKAGSYGLRLMVSDGLAVSDPDTVTITCAPPPVSVPDVVGMEKSNAEAAITAAGLTIGTLATRSSQSVPADHVISQSPSSGSSVPRGTAVSLTVSLGTNGPMLISIAVTPTELTLEAGESRQYTATGTYEDGTARVVTGEAVWSTTSGAIAQASSSGRIKALSEGETTVRATIDAVSGGAHLAVLPAKIVSISVSPQNPVVLTGHGQAFTATGTLADGSVLPITSGITWQSSEPAVASIASSGLASAIAEGATTITAAKDGLAGSTTLTVKSVITDTVPPTARIAAPLESSPVTSRIPIIGTAADESFLRYVVEVAPFGSETFTVIGLGDSPVVGGVLATFDPASLPNDFYLIRLTVLDQGGNVSTARVGILAAAKGLAFLTSNQNWDGSAGTDLSVTDYLPETTALIEALAALGRTDLDAYGRAVAWARSQSFEITDYVSRKVRTSIAAQEEMDMLPAFLDDSTGGFGGSFNFGANSLDTALALLALDAIGSTDTATLDAALSYLVSTQNGDGGWGATPEDASRVHATSLASIAIQRFAHSQARDAAVSAATDFLMARRNADGGFGDAASTSFETALSCTALAHVSSDVAALKNALAYLVSTQLPDGSWDGDPYCTALALKALAGVKPVTSLFAKTAPDTAPDMGEAIVLSSSGMTNAPQPLVIRAPITMKRTLNREDAKQLSMSFSSRPLRLRGSKVFENGKVGWARALSCPPSPVPHMLGRSGGHDKAHAHPMLATTGAQKRSSRHANDMNIHSTRG